MAKRLSYEELWEKGNKVSRELFEAAVVSMAEEAGAGEGAERGRVAAHRRECEAIEELVHCMRELQRRKAGRKRFVAALRKAAEEWTGVADVPIEEPGGETAKADQPGHAVAGKSLDVWSDGRV